MTVDRLARHATLYGTEGIFAAAVGSIDDRELARLAAILRRRGWRPTKAEQASIDKARASSSENAGAASPPILAMDATSGCLPLSPHVARVLSVTNGDSDPTVGPLNYGAQRDATCATCGHEFKAVRSTARYCGATCRKRHWRSGS